MHLLQKIFYSDFKREETLNSTLIKIKKKVGKPDAIIFTVGKSSPTKGNLTDYKNSFDINFIKFLFFISIKWSFLFLFIFLLIS